MNKYTPATNNSLSAVALALLALLASSPINAQTLPLTGPAYTLAEQAYKAYDRGDYDTAVTQAREAARQRPDLERLQVLLRKAERAQARRAGRAEPQAHPISRPATRSAKRADRRNAASAQAMPPRPDPAFAAADAGYDAFDRKDYALAISQAQEALRMAPANAGWRLLLVNSLIAAARLPEAQAALEEGLHAHFINTQGALVDTINKTGNWNDEIEATFKQGISEFKTTGSW